MQPTLEQITRYFRTSLDEELISFGSYQDSRAVLLNGEELQQGKVTSKEILRLAPKEYKHLKNFQIVIAPMCFQRLATQKGTAISPEKIIPLMAPCSFNKESQRLSAIKDQYPWFNRENLRPLVNKEAFTLGNLDDARAILAEDRQEFHALGWAAYFNYLIEAIQKLCPVDDEGLITLNGVQYIASHKPVAFRYESNNFITLQIRKAYDRLIEKNTPALYGKLVSGTEEVRETLQIEDEAANASSFHTAQMSNSFGLGASQRQTMHHYFACDEDEILAVNGPPGTGKTTLLQSAIASEWVNAIIDSPCGETIPPIIVATSSNNQAVTNVIRDFATVLKPESSNILERRWLPGKIDSLGTYYLSSSKAGQTSDYLTACHEWNGSYSALEGFFSKLESEKYTSEAYHAILKSYEEFTGNQCNSSSRLENLRAIQSDLRDQIISLKDAVGTDVSNWMAGYVAVQESEELATALANFESNVTACEAIQKDSLTEYREHEKRHSEHKQVVQHALAASKNEPFWFGLAKFLPFLKSKRKAYATEFMLRHDLDITSTPKDIASICDRLMAKLTSLSNAKKAAQQTLDAANNKLQKITAQHIQNKQRLTELSNIIKKTHACFDKIVLSQEFAKDDLYTLLSHADTNNRYTIFLLAIHYYEALWLEQTITDFESTQAPKLSATEQLRRISMLTPCIVSTLFMTPKLMSQSGKPIFRGIDLLIFDEAGQASIDKAAIVFALAKKALVVGDVHQIEPVVSLSEDADLGNIERFGLIANEETLDHLTISKSNAMLLAQRATPFQLTINDTPAKERGMHLLEHRRCPKTVINYCKELTYPNLEVLTQERPADSFLYPQLGYANIPSFSEKRNGSRYNTYEAANIAQWLADNRQKILTHYGASNLAEIIAIVTPFKLQSSEIKQQLKSKLPEADARAIVVGTVHKMQGAEKKIILLSPVYGLDDNALSFVDRKLNMLNVAVSRAKDSFIVFGNMELFNPESSKPSGILAKHLCFESGQNALKDFKLIERNLSAAIEHLSSLDDHRRVLKQCFEQAREELTIVSPYITHNALQADMICEAIANTKSRGVPVKIYTDIKCIQQVNNYNQQAVAQITEALKASGATIVFTSRLHNKTIKVDNHTVVEGSFNWLSANRGQYANLEHSILYRGKEIREFIQKIEASLSMLKAQR
ncbi:AAA domain-containing protein [Halodesulfovibrio spirochaetisodalis]|uniref:AAA domain-containing protein n=1 Tax=Halodesulfovibrio spirochaetisodalis TaxID=1560234 RepID=UPI00082AE557|nr:AAA domain-containing protein [Halodesulfovibrio spirochaetisodalis]